MSKGHQHGRDDGPPPAPEPLPVPVVDNHTHLDIARGANPPPDVTETLAAATAVGVDRAVQIGCDLAGARFTVQQVDRHPQLLGGVAIHPNEAAELVDAGGLQEAWDEIAELAQHDRIRVIGETGLDYFRTGPEGVDAQQDSFRWHIRLAKGLGKALQIHDRDAHADVMRILAEEGAPDRTVMHCFSGDADLASECVSRGYFLSFSGTVTFKNAADLREALVQVPLDRVLVETDAPFLAPSPYRGAVNAPYLVPVTVRAMAEVLRVDVATLCRAISQNSERVYGSWGPAS